MLSGLQDSKPGVGSQAEIQGMPAGATTQDTPSAWGAEDEAEDPSSGHNKDDPLMVGGFGVRTGATVKAGRQQADRGMTFTTHRKAAPP